MKFYGRCASRRSKLAGASFSLLFFSIGFKAYAQGAVCQAAYSTCMEDAGTLIPMCEQFESLGSIQQYNQCMARYQSYKQACSTGQTGCTEMYVFPKGKVASILYMPPGNKSTVGYSSTASSGTTDTYSESFSSSNTGLLSFGIDGFSLGGSLSDSNTSTITTVDTTSIQNTESTTWATSGDPIDHTQDVLTIWLNPQVTVANYPSTGQLYNFYTYISGQGGAVISQLGNAAYNPSASGNGGPVVADAIAGGDMDNINVTVYALQHPTTLLPSQLVSRTNDDGTVVPGLLSLCANRIAESQCTASAAQQSACGCSAADFSQLVQVDPFFNPNIASPTIANINAADPNNARFVPVKNASGNDLEIPIQSGVTQSVGLTDAYNTSTTYTNTVSNSYNATLGYSGSGVDEYGNKYDFKASDSMTWTSTESVGHGTSSGTAHTQSLVLATTNPSCYEYVNIYLDTLFHTFVFDNGSNAANPCP